MGSCLSAPTITSETKTYVGQRVASESLFAPSTSGTESLENSCSDNSAFAIHQTRQHFIQQDLIEYLYRYNNYQQFSHYLTTHFAQENLSFIALIVVFRNIYLSGLTTEETETFKNLPVDNFLDKLYNVKFEYLCNLNNEIQKRIDANELKYLLYNIRDRFINESAETSINISCEARRKLIAYFNQLSEFKSTEIWESELKFECLNLFNQAISEIYDVLNTQYRTYCHQY